MSTTSSVGDVTYYLSLRLMFEEGYTFIERCAKFVQGFKLLFGVLDVVKIVASQGIADGEAD
jgi:hypothetical protein